MARIRNIFDNYYSRHPESLETVVSPELGVKIYAPFVENTATKERTKIAQHLHATLFYIVSNVGKTLSEANMHAHVYEGTENDAPNTKRIQNNIEKLKKLLSSIEIESERIETVPNHGYIIRSIIPQSTSAPHSE